MIQVVTALGQGDAQDELLPIGGVHAEDAVEVIGNQSQTGYIQVVVFERVQRQRAQAAGLAENGEG